MNLYRIFTENKNREQIQELTSRLFEGFTIYQAIGFYKRCQEKSLVLEIITNQTAKVKLLAGRIKRLNEQESILLEIIQNNAEFI